MKNMPNKNIDTFYHAEKLLKKKGYIPINPFECGKSLDNVVFGSEKEKYEEYLRFDIRALTFCDSIYMLKGWQDSNGANIELIVARAIGLEALYE
jgi:hypothetical protein